VAEICDGIDNNCDGTADNGIEPVATTCGVGACASTGTSSCEGGVLVDSCQAGAPVAEICDGIDNNCDGTADNGIEPVATTCGVGACASTGTASCEGGQLVDSCQAGSPVAEICDGIDNNCDGTADNGIEPVATTCGVGACEGSTGTANCVNGALVDSCDPLAGATAEACDGIDNNCNGAVDDGITCGCINGQTRDVACGTGACAATGTETCVNGEWSESTCVPGEPVAEVCDGIDNNCNGSVDDGIEPVATTCGVGACASTGISSCEGGVLVDSCQAGTAVAEICDGIDNNCNGSVDDGIEPVATTCGVGACASTGTASCEGGQLVDSCQAGAAVAEVCDGIDNNCNGSVDDGIADMPTICGIGACASNGMQTCSGGELVDSCQPGTPAAFETCDNDIDDNCDGLTDGEDTVACAAGPPAVPTNVQATDCDPVNYDPAHFDITVTWDPVQGAEYYRVHRAIFAEDNSYEVVADNVIGTSFEYIQTWQEDVLDIIGPTPGLSPTADFDRIDPVDLGPPYAERQAFIDALNLYREEAVPTLFNFKAPAFFRVQACNSVECSDLSAADAGSAEYIHTAEFSEVAQHMIPTWGYAQLVALADAPPGANGLSWCGIDLCGSGGGIAMGRVLLGGTRVNIDVGYDEFTETLATAPSSYVRASGRLSGRMPLATASDGQFLLSGSFTLELNERSQIGLSMYARIGAYATDGETRYSDGVAAITYKGQSYQFTLPIQPIDGISGHPAAAPTPVIPAVTIPPTGWVASTSPFPTPLVPEEVDPECMRVWTGYVLEECPVSIAP